MSCLLPKVLHLSGTVPGLRFCIQDLGPCLEFWGFRVYGFLIQVEGSEIMMTDGVSFIKGDILLASQKKKILAKVLRIST